MLVRIVGQMILLCVATNLFIFQQLQMLHGLPSAPFPLLLNIIASQLQELGETLGVRGSQTLSPGHHSVSRGISNYGQTDVLGLDLPPLKILHCELQTSHQHL